MTSRPVGLVCADWGCIIGLAPLLLPMPPSLKGIVCLCIINPPNAVSSIAARTNMVIMLNILMLRFSIFMIKLSLAAINQIYVNHGFII